MMPTVNAPFSDGGGESFSNYSQEVVLRAQTTNLEPVKRASALILNVGPVAREVRMAAGCDQIRGRAA